MALQYILVPVSITLLLLAHFHHCFPESPGYGVVLWKEIYRRYNYDYYSIKYFYISQATYTCAFLILKSAVCLSDPAASSSKPCFIPANICTTQQSRLQHYPVLFHQCMCINSTKQHLVNTGVCMHVYSDSRFSSSEI